MNPTVCCVMLVNGRAAMVKRAIASFRSQTYERKRLLIWDSSPALSRLRDRELVRIFHMPAPIPIKATIGALRNEANQFACLAGDQGDLIAHWDSDDWSHPRRLEEQVALLLASGKQCVGYRELLFWDTRGPGEAWIYRNDEPRFACGASYMYTRALWEQQPFPDAPHEDRRWWLTPLVSNACVGVSSFRWGHILQRHVVEVTQGGMLGLPADMYRKFEPAGEVEVIDGPEIVEPRMVCGIHGGNTESYDRAAMAKATDVWRRAPEFDSYCAGVMQL